LDVAVFHPLKLACKQTVNNLRLENNGERLKKEMFAPVEIYQVLYLKKYSN